MGRILWLASYPKSGNTWLRAFLHNALSPLGRPADINRLDELTAGDSEPSLYEAAAGRPAATLTPQDTIALRRTVHAGLAGRDARTRIVKTHSAVMTVFGHPTFDMSLTAGALYIVRNPLDVAVSFAHHLGEPLERIVETMGRDNAMTAGDATAVAELIGSWSQHVESWTGRPNPGLHVVRYEDLLARPREGFGAVAAFLGLGLSRERLDKAIRQSSFDILRRQEDRAGFREKSPRAERFFRSGTAGEGRRTLPDDLAAALVERHRVQMARFGYLEDGGTAP